MVKAINCCRAAATSVFAFTLPVESDIQMEILNLLGERVALLAEQRFGPGDHRITWSGRDPSGWLLSSGIYFCRLQAKTNNGKMRWSGMTKLIVLP
jgi:hypothetical protein